MFKLDDNFLHSIGLGSLPVEEKNKMLAHIYDRLEMNVGMRLAEQMSDEQLDEFEGFIDTNDEAGALKWLETNFPDYKQVVADELEKLKREITQLAPQIMAASQPQMGAPGGVPGAAPGAMPGPGPDTSPSVPSAMPSAMPETGAPVAADPGYGAAPAVPVAPVAPMAPPEPPAPGFDANAGFPPADPSQMPGQAPMAPPPVPPQAPYPPQPPMPPQDPGNPQPY